MKPRTLGKSMVEIPEDEWPFMPGLESVALGVWMSADYLAVLYEQKIDGNKRLTVNRTRRDRSKRPGQSTDWKDGITWDELQRVKSECLGEVWCVEVYPPTSALVDVSNMRHLWVLEEPPATRFPEKSVVSKQDADAALSVIKTLLRR